MDNISIYILKEKIKLDYFKFFQSKEIGAISSFTGVVRINNKNKIVDHILYYVFDDLMCKLIRKECEILTKNDFFTKILIIQGVGKIFVSEINLIVAVGSSHKDKAFMYCNHIVNFIKQKAPIWKKEYYIDNSFEWINS